MFYFFLEPEATQLVIATHTASKAEQIETLKTVYSAQMQRSIVLQTQLLVITHLLKGFEEGGVVL